MHPLLLTLALCAAAPAAADDIVVFERPGAPRSFGLHDRLLREQVGGQLVRGVVRLPVLALRRREKSLQRVVLLQRDRVVLVVVTTSAAHGQP